jgi:hypothetical protein
VINTAKDWNDKQNKVRSLLFNKRNFIKGKNLLLEMHSLLHNRHIYESKIETFYDKLWKGLKVETCKIISNKETSILWNIWHITRIEDLISNIIIGDKDAILNDKIQSKLNIDIKDTGNAFSYSDLESFNKNINISALKDYRLRVGRSTKKIIEFLVHNDMKKKVTPEHLEKIKQNGGVTDDPKSTWLLDFWGKKNIFGLIMMPITRHQIVHLNDGFRIKQKYNEGCE